MIKIRVWTCDMTSTSYLGKKNSTLGFVVPLAMFFVLFAFCFYYLWFCFWFCYCLLCFLLFLLQADVFLILWFKDNATKPMYRWDEFFLPTYNHKTTIRYEEERVLFSWCMQHHLLIHVPSLSSIIITVPRFMRWLVITHLKSRE